MSADGLAPDMRAVACESLGRSIHMLTELQFHQMHAGAAMNAGFIHVRAARAPMRPEFGCVSIVMSGRYTDADIERLKQFIEGMDQDASAGCNIVTLGEGKDGEVSS